MAARVQPAGAAVVAAAVRAEQSKLISAPIFEADGSVEAAVHIHGPAYRFPDPHRSHDLGIMVIDAATSIADHLATD